MNDNVRNMHSGPPPPRTNPASGGNGNGHNLHGRVSAIEAHLWHLATKDDIQRIEALIAKREASMQRWLIGILVAVCGSLAVALTSIVVALIRAFTA